MLSYFAIVRIPVILAVFLCAHILCRRRWTAMAFLPLLGLLLTSAGDTAGAWEKMCIFFGAAHIGWFAFLAGRGRFSWPTAGILTFVLLPFLTVVVFPKIGGVRECAFAGYAFCTILSVSAAVGARKSPGGGFYLAGLTALMVSDIGIALDLADVRGAAPAVAPLYVLALTLLLIALVRGLPAPQPAEKLAPPLTRQHQDARVMLCFGLAIPLLFLAAMVFYNGQYCWYTDFISESGLITIGKNRPNHLAAWLLTSGLTAAGLLCGWYFVERFRWGDAPRWQRALILAFGVLGAIGLAGIGGAPFDRHPDVHNFCTLCTVPFGIAILLSALTGDDRFGRRSEKSIWLIFILFILAVVGGLAFLVHQKAHGLPSNPTGPFMQKMTVLAFYIYMLGQVIAYARNTRTPGSGAITPATAE